jgi:hypothetical protein
MQLLIVHQDAEIGEGLTGLVHEFSGHAATYLASAAAACKRIEQNGNCELLLTQVDGAGIDGVALASSLGEIAPNLQTFFLPAYTLAEQRFEIAKSKIFPEPIDGEGLLVAIERLTNERRAPNEYHLIDLLQMFCLSGKSGAVQLFAGAESGVVFLRNGELRHAATPRAVGLDAISEMLRLGPVRFSYNENASPSEQTIEIGWDAALAQVVRREREDRAAGVGETGIATEIEASPLPAEPDLTGQQLGTYLVGRKLTESFFDKVYEAEQTSVRRPVALHVLRRSLRQIPERAQQFLEAASANANVRHPAILPVYEAGEFEGTHFYAREFVVGRTLYEIKASGLTISALVALRLIRAIAEALVHLDDHQILHGPLRLSRIFVTPNDEAKLADVAVASPALAQLEPSRHEIQMIGRLLIPMTKATAMPGSGRVLKLIHQMQTAGPGAITEWPVLAREAQKLEVLLAPAPVREAAKTTLIDKVKSWRKASGRLR